MDVKIMLMNFNDFIKDVYNQPIFQQIARLFYILINCGNTQNYGK